jgi:glycosyltransferase involved in cell wall biosynthesis
MRVIEALKILVLCPDLPFPIRAGGQMRMASLIEALSAFSMVKVAFVASEVPKDTLSWARDRGISIDPFRAPPPRAPRVWRERLVMLLTMSNLRSRAIERAFFNQAFDSYRPSLVWLETPYLIRYALPWKSKAPLVVDYWGTSEGAKRIYDISSGPIRIWRLLQWRAARGGEQGFATQVENIVTVSPIDAAYFKRLAPRSRIWVIPNGILGKSTPCPTSEVDEDSKSMIFTGDMSYEPNVDAMLWFSREILPLVLEELPDARLKIVGRNPNPEIEKLNRRRSIDVVGYVENLAEAIAASGLYILPMRLGSGIRSKLFDVFPLGKAIITTTVGAEGLELTNDQNCLIADTPRSFASACIRLIRHQNERKRLGSAALHLASHTYSQQNVTRIVRDTVRDILQTQ